MAARAEIQIGELARRSGCHVETIRYYERIKLLPLPSRSAGRYRLGFIRRARELGFTLEEARALLALSTHDGRTACAEVRQLAAGHLEEVRAKIADLKAMETVLADAVRRCDAGELPGCPLIDSLSAVTD
jgi:MerR family transcriptional regulator, mercuric resistance operon regulatory protein